MKILVSLASFTAALLVAAVTTARLGLVSGLCLALAFYALLSAVLAPRQAACFANNFGVLSNTIVVYDAFSQFLENLLPLRNIVLDVQDERTGVRTGKPGDVITVKDWRTTVTPYQPNPTYTAQDIDISTKDRQVTLPNLPWAVSFALTAGEYRLLSSGATGGAEYATFRDKLRNLMVNGIGKKVMDLWFAVITTANYPDVSNQFVSAAGTFTRSVEVDLDTKFFGRNVPTEGAQVIGSPALYGEWVKDHVAIQTNTADNRQKSLLVQGGIQSQNSNFTFWRTNRTLGADCGRGFAISKTGVIGAFRVPDEATFEQDPVSLQTLIDPITGIPLLARLHKVTTTGAIQLDLATLPVFAKGQEEAVERIEATA